jgi:choline dehydrogenase-like flavoprotein
LRDTFDIVIVGSGFAGSLLAMIARRLAEAIRAKSDRMEILIN